MNIPNDIATKIEQIVNSTRGCNIGTSLQMYLEEKVNAVLPPKYSYAFTFNMSGGTQHHFKDNETGEVVVL